MMKRSIAIAILLAFAPVTYADTIYLKNRGVLKGVIRAEDPYRVTLAIGTGTMKISRDQIESIEKASEKENAAIEAAARKKAVERGSLIPDSFINTAKQLSKLTANRKTVDEAKKRLDNAKSLFYAKNEEYRDIKIKFDFANVMLSRIDPEKNIGKYNSYLTEMNSLGSELSAFAKDLDTLNAKMLQCEHNYWEAITDYGNAVGNFRLEFDKKVEDIKDRGISEEESLYAAIVLKSLSDIEKGLSKDSVALTKTTNGMTVKAVLNGNTTCLLAVDTGASMVVISRKIAQKIWTSPGRTIKDVEFKIADGSIIKNDVIIVKSIRVGNSTAYDVPVAVSDNPPGHGIDGLLGMSFLSNFNIKMDVANEKLVLETIK